MLRSPISRALMLGGALLALAVFAGPAPAYTGTGADARNLQQTGAAVAALAPPGGSVGAAGVGDPYFPLLGNGGYDVRHYDMTLAYDPATDRLDATAVIEARATAGPLALRPRPPAARCQRRPRERRSRPSSAATARSSRSRPANRVANRSTFEVAVEYGGIPQTIVGSPIVFGSPYGFLHTDDGAFVGAEPNAQSTWMPLSDHPSDKAELDLPGHGPGGQVRRSRTGASSRR